MKDNFNINTYIRSSVQSLKPYSSARDEFKELDTDMVFLDANESPFENGVNRYPDPQQTSVKQRLAVLKNVSETQILLGNGSDEVLDLIFRVFCEPNQDKIITLPPTYGMYSVLANINAVENLKIPLGFDFQPDVDEILRVAHTYTKLLFLCSPNNPTANSFEAIRVEKLLNEFDGIVVIDEAYIDFSKQDSWLSRLDDFPNLIVTQTLSKAYGLAGIRLGICYASTAIISALNKIKPPYNVNVLTQQRALQQLNNIDSVKIQIQDILSERTRLIKALKEIKYVFKIYPTDANFVLIEVDNANERYNRLIEKGIVIRNRTSQLGCEDCLRLAVGTQEENSKLINALKSIV